MDYKLSNLKFKIKFYLLFILGLIIAISGALSILYIISRNAERNNCKEKAECVVDILVDLIDPNLLKKYKTTLIIDDEYRSEVRKIDKYANSAKIKKMFILAPFDSENYIHIYDSSEIGDGIEDSIYGRRLLGTKGKISNWTSDIFSGNKNYKKSDFYKINSEWGYVCTAVAPIKDENNSVIGCLGIDYDMNYVQERINKDFLVFGLISNLYLVILIILYGI